MDNDADSDISECRALVPVSAPATDAPRSRRSEGRPLSTFTAHLIATAMHAPQTRAQRRGEPEDVIRRYEAPRQTNVRYLGLTLSESF